MLASDAGFVATASSAPEGEDEFEDAREDDPSNRNRHCTVAIELHGRGPRQVIS